MTDKRLQKQAKDIEAPEDKQVKEAFRRVASTEEGVMVLRWLMEYCGYKLPSTVYNPLTNEIVQSATNHNESKRCTWLDVRKMIPKTKLNVIEAER